MVRNFHGEHYATKERGTESSTEGMGTRERMRAVEKDKRGGRESERDKKREVSEKGLFKGLSGSNVAFIGLLSAKHWSRAPR